MSGTVYNDWYDDYGAAQWNVVSLALPDYAAEQVEAAQRHLLPLEGGGVVGLARPILRSPLLPSSLVHQTEQEIREGRHPRPRPTVGLLLAVTRIFDGVLLRGYYDALAEPDRTRLYKILLVSAARELQSPRCGGAFRADEAEDLVQEVLFRAFAGRRPWPRVEEGLLPLVPFLRKVIKSVASHSGPRSLALQLVEDEELERLASSSGTTSPSQEEIVRLKELALHLLSDVSGRDRQILRLVLQGCKAQEVHDRLGVPLSTAHRRVRELTHEIEAAITELPHVDKDRKEL